MTKPRVGRTPDILRKGGPMTDKTKVIPRKQKNTTPIDDTKWDWIRRWPGDDS